MIISHQTSKYLLLISFLLLVGFYLKLYKNKSLIFIVILSITFLRLSAISYPKPSAYVAKIIQINENYVIGKVNHTKVMIYSDLQVNYDNTISFTGNYEEIYTPVSKYSFQFDKYMLRNNIKYSVKAKNVKVIKEKLTLRSELYKIIKKHPDHELLSKIFLKINNRNIEYNIIFLMSSAGVIIKSLIRMIKKLLEKYIYEKYVFVVEILLYLFFMFTFKHYLFYLNILIYTFLIKIKYNRADATFLSSTIILLINPLYMYSLSFIINFLFRVMACISLNKNYKFIEGLIVILPIQLRMFYKANIIQIIGYRYYKVVGVVAYLLGIIDIVFKSRFVKSFLSLTDFNIYLTTVTGHMSNIILLLWVFFALLVLSRNSIFYKFALMFLLIINQNQLLFNPSLVYTQLYVGQGDCAIMRYPFKREVLFIDTGPPVSRSKVTDYLDYYGVKKIHSMIITHDDMDHSGNRDFLKSAYIVNSLVETPKEIDFYGLKIYSVNFGMEDLNENSLISYFTINDWTYLTLGDASKRVELMFLNDYPHIKPDIVKLGHHGSDTSSSDELLRMESIKLLLNSSGYKNMYKHPNYLVKQRILKYGLPFIDTQQVGEIEIIHFLGYNFLTY